MDLHHPAFTPIILQNVVQKLPIKDVITLHLTSRFGKQLTESCGKPSLRAYLKALKVRKEYFRTKWRRKMRRKNKEYGSKCEREELVAQIAFREEQITLHESFGAAYKEELASVKDTVRKLRNNLTHWNTLHESNFHCFDLAASLK